MKSTTRNLLCAITAAPVVALLVGAPPAAAADEGPLAALLQRDGTKGSAADLARPVLGPFPYFASEAVRSAGTARVESRRDGAHEATALLGPTTSEKYDLQAKGIGSKCVAPAKGPIRGTTLIDEGRLQGRKLPDHPAVNQQIPLRDGAYAILNKQVRSVEGFTVIGTQFVDKAGKTTDLAKSHCVTPKRAVAAQRRVPDGNAQQQSPTDPEIANGALDGLLKGLTGSLFDMQKRLDTYLSRKSPVSLGVNNTLGKKIDEAAAASSTPGGTTGSSKPGTAPKAPQPGPKKAPQPGQRVALAPEPQPKLLGEKLLSTETEGVFTALRGSGTNSGLKSSLFEKDESTESGLFGGLPGLSQLPANVSDLLQGYSLG